MTKTSDSAPVKRAPSTIRIGKRYRASRIDSDYDAIVIGSGIGGLATAACLSKQGKKVIVLEQHYTAGGFTHSYSRNGYEWDVGVHYIGDMGSPNTLARKIFDYITDGELKWAPMDEVYDRFYIGDEVYELRAGKAGFRESILAAFPDEGATVDRYLKMLSKVAQGMQAYSLGKIVPSMAAPAYHRMLKMILPDYFNKTTYEVLSSLTSNQRLIAVLAGQWGDCGVPPRQSSFLIHALIAKHYLHGGYYPVGGASRIAETIIPVIQASGGEVFTYADVKEIITADGKGKRATGVRMADGEVLTAPLIISNAGALNTYEKLLPESARIHSGYTAKRQTISPSMSHLGMYIGIKGTSEELGLPKTNFWIYPEENYDDAVTAFMKDPSLPFPVVYISFPSAKDPSYNSRYPGRSAIEIVAPTTYEQFEQWKDTTWGKRGEDYETLKQDLTDRMLEALYTRLPQLRGNIDYFETSTPLSTDFFCRYSQGEIYGLTHDTQRFEQSWLRPQTPVKGLWLTGQDALTCGVVGAMIAGVLTAAAALGLRSVPMLRNLLTWKPGRRNAPVTLQKETA
ncbi:NAD(P)/FAD-dependent oxidoreductase [Allohahella marinimesophila]|uniref:NAD(P)/FAD-dependent oxidoreductase n=1 Tax=Allohahella marinimesophila TaxID=1054972 RepID=A0ABP7NGS8_9GAMM